MRQYLRAGILAYMHAFVRALIISGASLVALVPLGTNAQELVLDTQSIMKARVVEVISEEAKNIPGTLTPAKHQTIKVYVLDGVDSGKDLVVDNDYYYDLKVGEVFYLMHTTNPLDGTDYYAVTEPYRIRSLLFFVGLFVLCVVVFGGKQGIRGLMTLGGSLLLIFFVLFPGILQGYSPVLLSVGVSAIIIILGSYITHGFNRTTTAAVLGMLVTIVVTGVIAYFAVDSTRLRGLETEDAMYLNLNMQGAIDLVGLLLGGILIGLLGVLYDAAIGQAVAVEELRRAGPNLSAKHVFLRALRIGREHIGALVNILALAYVGAALPLLLLFYTSKFPFSVSVNNEIFATEIIRSMIGSIGLILAIPITTLISVFILFRTEK
jgi:uncharacterized membrane protein